MQFPLARRILLILVGASAFMLTAFGGLVTAKATASIRVAALSQFGGQIVALTGNTDNPTGFTLQMKSHNMDFKISPTTVFTARSAQAELQGFSVNDYAIVEARHVRRTWISTRIDFDITPIVPNQITLTGSVWRISINQKRLAMKLDTGDVRWVNIIARTRYRIDAQPIDGTLVLTKGEVVEIRAQRTVHGLFALDINLKTTTPSPRS